MNNVEIFLNKYKELEQLVKDKLDIKDFQSPIYELSKHKDFMYYKDDINYLREVRNLLTHRPKVNNNYPLVPSDEIISLLDKIIRLVAKPLVAYNIMLPINKVVKANINDKVVDYINIMINNGYSHIPILKDNKLIGVFSQTSLFFAFSKDHIINKDSLFDNDLINLYCGINKESSEKYLFVNRNMSIQQIQDLFSYNYKKNNRVVMIFVTNSGIEDEDILGIITPYDAMDKDNR